MRYSEIFENHITYDVSRGPDTVRTINRIEPDMWTSRRIRYLVRSEADHENHIVAWDGDKIVGMAGVQTNPHWPEQLWIKFISVDPVYQGQGIARNLLERIYRYARDHGQRLKPGSFTEEGERLQHIHDEFNLKYPGVSFKRNGRYYVDDDGKIIG